MHREAMVTHVYTDNLISTSILLKSRSLKCERIYTDTAYCYMDPNLLFRSTHRYAVMTLTYTHRHTHTHTHIYIYIYTIPQSIALTIMPRGNLRQRVWNHLFIYIYIYIYIYIDPVGVFCGPSWLSQALIFNIFRHFDEPTIIPSMMPIISRLHLKRWCRSRRFLCSNYQGPWE